MSEWIEPPLEELADISSGGTPSRTNASFWGGDIPWVTPSDITGSDTNYIFDTNDTITEHGLTSSSAKLLPAGALLLTSRATIGEVRIAARPLATNQGFKNIAPKAGADGLFLFYQLSRLKGRFERYAAGSTFLEINRKDTGRITIPLPKDEDEQRKIACILQTIDRAIEKTEAVIDKYQQIKAGLMRDLFTRGIGPDGQLRPPHEQAPELYQETPIGWIPKEWDLRAGAECFKLYGGAVPSVLNQSDSGAFLYLIMSHVQPGSRDEPPGIDTGTSTWRRCGVDNQQGPDAAGHEPVRFYGAVRHRGAVRGSADCAALAAGLLLPGLWA